MPYQLTITVYHAPDRGDSKGGWRYAERAKVIKARNDEEAKEEVKRYIVAKFGACRNDVRGHLKFVRSIPLGKIK